MLALPGSAYIYQGEELGLPEVVDLPDEVRQDPIWARSGRTDARPRRLPGAAPVVRAPAAVRLRPARRRPVAAAAGRVGRARGRGPGGRPRLDAELYRAALRLRRTAIPRGEPFAWVEGLPDGVLAFRRGRFLCVVNVGDEPFTPPVGLVAGAELLLASDPTYADPSSTLPGATTAWYRTP